MSDDPRHMLCEFPLGEPLSEWAAVAIRTRLLWLSSSVVDVTVTPSSVRVFTVREEVEPELAGRVRDGVEEVLSLRGYAARGDAARFSHTAGAPRMEAAEVHARLTESGQLTELGAGMYGYTGNLLHLVRTLSERLGAVGRAMGGVEYMYPSVVDLEVAHRARYLEKFPHHLFLLSHFEQNAERIDEVSAAARRIGGAAELLEHTSGSVARPRWAANPLGCYHVFQQLSGRRLPSQRPSRFVTTGRCMRFEAAGTEGLCRLSNYTLVETVTLGSEADVLEAREQAQARICEVARALDLSFAVHPAADPFFRVEDARVGLLQQLFGLKHELLVEIPGRAAPLAVASFNLHGDAFTRAFEITGPHEPTVSCCTGCGVERWAIAFLCRHGVDRRDWPVAVEAGTPA